MRRTVIAAAFAASLLMGGCSTIPDVPLGDELEGRTMRVVSANGQTTMLHFADDDIVHASFGNNDLSGRWEVVNGQLCFFWPGAPRECWPYPNSFRRGETRTVTSDRGNTIQVTLQ